MTRKILAFYSPYPGAGKSTAAEYLMFVRDGLFSDKLSFAGPLHAMVNSALVQLGFAEDGRCKDIVLSTIFGFSKRDLLIAWGRAARELYPNFWSEYMRGKLHRFSYGSVNIVIDDLRFPNEYAMLREEGAKIVRITNPGREIVPSETEALLEGYEFDAELVNDKQDLATYEAKLDKLLAELWPE